MTLKSPSAALNGAQSSPELTQLFDTLGRELLGRLDMKEAQRQLRRAMCREALQRTGGSRRAAASLLGVDRRYVQRLMRDLSVDEPRNVSHGPSSCDVLETQPSSL